MVILARLALVWPQYRDDRRDRVGWLVRRDHDAHALVGLGWLQGVELATEQLPGEEVVVPGGQPPGEHLPVHGKEHHPDAGTAAEQQVPVGAPQRPAGHHGRLTPGDALVDPAGYGPQPRPAGLLRPPYPGPPPPELRCPSPVPG